MVNKLSIPNRVAFVAAVLGGLVFLLWLRFYQPPNTVDDAYITFRYARNLVNGVGFVYNPGERVLGTTTPAYAALLAVLCRLSGLDDYPRLALITNALLDAVTFCLLARLGARLIRSRWIGLSAALLFAIDGRTLDWSTGGMESSFNVVAIILTFVLFFEKHPRLAALTGGLAVLIRPDGATLAAALFAAWGLGWLRKQAPFPWREGAIFGAAVVPWVLFAFIYFGTPIPQSVLAKSVVYRLPPLIGLRAFLVQLRTIFPFSLPPLQEGQSLVRQILQALLPAGLCVLGLAALQRRHAQVWVVGAYIALFVAFFSIGNPLWLGWYETPLMPLYWTLILGAIAWIGGRIANFLLPLSTQAALRAVLVIGAVIVLAIPQLSRLNLILWETPQHAPFVLNPTFNKQREADYELFARMLAPAAHNHRLVAIPEIGAFGYDYPGPVFDTTGLISPLVLKYFPIPKDIPIEIYSVPRPLIFDLRPDLFVSFDSFIRATLAPDDPAFLQLYRPTIGLTSHAAFGIQRLMAYRRADLPIEASLPPEARPVDVGFGPDLVTLEGYATRFWAETENNFLEVTLFWRNHDARLDRDLLVRVNLLSREGQPVYQILDQPGEALFPTQIWTPGMLLVDRYQLKRPVLDAGPYTVTVTLFDSHADDPLPAHAASGAPLAGGTFVIPPIQIP